MIYLIIAQYDCIVFFENVIITIIVDNEGLPGAIGLSFLCLISS